MKNELVVKDNALINASYNLDVSEQRLILLSIVRARETGQGITADSRLEIHASDYMKQFNVDKSTAYEVLKNAVDNLFNRYFSYKYQRDDGTEFVAKSRWVSRIAYASNVAILEVTFAPDVVPLITRLEKHFTSYQLNQVSQLTSKYAIRIYELLIAWRSVGNCSFDLEDFRDSLGLGVNEYPAMNNFKKRVLEPALKQINDLTDITVKYEQRKTGRVISGFDFRFKVKDQIKKEKSAKLQNTTDRFITLTDKQVTLFAHKLANDSVFASKHAEVGESYKDLEQRLVIALNDPEKVTKWLSDLKRVGLK